MRATAWATAVVAVLALWLASMVGAGTEEDPEIEDPSGDQHEAGQFAPADLLKVWIENETAQAFTVHFLLGGDVGGSNVEGVATTYYTYQLDFQVAGTAYTAGADVNWDVGAAPTGVANNASRDGPNLLLRVNKTDVGSPAAGDAITNLTASTSVNFFQVSPVVASDTAPDDGFGRAYNFTVGGGGGDTTTSTTTTTSASPTDTTTTTSGTTTTTTTSPTNTTTTTSTGPGDDDDDDDGGGSLQERLLDENRNYFFAAVGAGLLLVILAVIGLKRWSL